MAYNIQPLGGFNVGNALSDALAQRDQRAKQQQMQELSQRAAQGDTQAIEQLYAIDPSTAQAFEQRMFEGQQRKSDEYKLKLEEQQKNSVDFIKKLHFLPEEQREAAMQMAVDDDRFDFDEEDMVYAKEPNAIKMFLGEVLKEQSFKSIFGGEQPEKMTEYQQEMIKGNKADRELRKAEIENKRIDNKLKTETNKVKLDQLKAKKIENEEKRDQIKKAKSDAAQTVVDSGQSTLELISEIENHPGFESAIGAKGASSLFGLLDSPISGTEAAGVNALIETLEAQNFLTAIGEFKSAGGAGSLSDNEGKKLGAALSNLSTAQNEEDFKKSLNVIKKLVKKQVSKARPQIEKRFTLEPSESKKIELSDEELLKKYGG